MSENLAKNLQFLTQKQTAHLLNVSERTLERWRAEGQGPPFVALGPRRRGYRLSDIEAWTSSQIFGSNRSGQTRGRGLMPAMPNFLTIGEVAQLLGVCTRTVSRWIISGRLVAHRAGGVVRIARADFESFLRQHRGTR